MKTLCRLRVLLETFVYENKLSHKEFTSALKLSAHTYNNIEELNTGNASLVTLKLRLNPYICTSYMTATL